VIAHFETFRRHTLPFCSAGPSTRDGQTHGRRT
jgi:hypothetical protein